MENIFIEKNIVQILIKNVLVKSLLHINIEYLLFLLLLLFIIIIIIIIISIIIIIIIIRNFVYIILRI